VAASTPIPTELPHRRVRTVLRLCGVGLVAACAAMLLLGNTALAQWLQGGRFVLYWSGCFLLAVTAIAVAIAELWLLRRALRQTQRALFRSHFISAGPVRRLRSAEADHGKDSELL
jgi:hypothetical protein